MRRLAIVAVLVGVVLPIALAQERVTVERLEGILSQSQSMSDGDLAAKLSDLKLTERFSTEQAAQWMTKLPGAKSQRALTGLADRSALLAPPPAEMPSLATPDLNEQRRIMGLTAAYVTNAIPDLPKFYATRTITHFEDAAGSASIDAPMEGGALHAMRITRATVLYRQGEEVVEPGPVKTSAQATPDRGLRTWGVFGPILGLVLVDAAQNTLAWSHWEKGPSGPVAVFRYAVPEQKSHYEVRYCCVTSTYGLESSSFSAMSGYHGEIGVDPQTGTIVRLTLEAKLQPDDPISRAASVVEYAPVELGGKKYICPVHSVSIAVAKSLKRAKDSEGRAYPVMGPPQMLLNDADFDQYHLFQSEVHVLSAAEERTAGAAPDATLPTAPPADARPTDEELSDAPAAKPAAGDVAGAGFAASAAANGEVPEISSTAATALPEGPVQPAPSEQPANAQGSAYTLRLNARLVDVNVVALDKKGRPIPNLKPEDFEVYDNGVKQNVHTFSQADQNSTQAAQPSLLPTEFSNHGAQPLADDRNTIVLLIDGSNLALTDFANARQQAIQFLKTLQPDEKVALYAMRYHNYEILSEATTDHAALVAKLKKWVPSSQDIANAEDEEQRNRQQIEYVNQPEDMLSVNGNFTLDTGSQTEPLDPQLREMGSRPGPNALHLLVEVSHHLAAIPGHKSLIWITSDNVLADWNKTSVTIDKGSKFIEPAALKTQEAMNNAHVSVYPLDASHLEANVIQADIGNRNVELTPTFQRSANPLTQETEREMEGPEFTATMDTNPYAQNRAFGSGGRLDAQMQQDMHAIQGIFREIAEATGGRALRRSNDMLGQFDGVVAEGHATYLMGFTPTMPADGQYHLLTVKLVGHKDATLRYRTGYKYDAEPTTLKDRFKRAIWETADASEIAVSTKPITDAGGKALRVTVAGTDLALSQQSALWMGKLDIFLVRRDDVEQHATLSGHTVGLRLKPATYQRAINEGLTFDERIESKPANGSSLRVVVVDVNSGRIGSVTVPASALTANP
jgi:VWFA-related protein